MHVNYRAVEELCEKYPFARTLQFISRDLEPLSPKAKQFFAKMPLAEWTEWRPRYIKLASLAAVQAVPQLCPPMTSFEREVFAALVLRAAKPTDEALIN